MAGGITSPYPKLYSTLVLVACRGIVEIIHSLRLCFIINNCKLAISVVVTVW